MKWYKKEVTMGMFMKLMIVLNIFFLWTCFRYAYISDMIEEEETAYIQYLEERVELQKEIIRLYGVLYEE